MCKKDALLNIIFLLSVLSLSCQQPGQQVQKAGLVGGGCDGCELMFIGIPANIGSADTSAGWWESGQPLLVTGTVFEIDGLTPAPNVIVYYWQTDNAGYYSAGKSQPEGTRRHGHIRGWVKSDTAGHYAIYTIRPAPYPKEDIPAHIHLSIKEPDIANEYYTDELVFDDDPLLTGAKRKALENRGGSGVLRVLEEGKLQTAEHNIILGLHIPNYPKKAPSNLSGLEIGLDQPSFIPYHAYGPDKGSRACPVCKYGRYNGILYFVGDHPDWPDIKKWLAFLEKESIARGKFLKVYFVYGNSVAYNKTAREKELADLGAELGLQKTALSFVPSFADVESEVYLNKINPEVKNTFILYNNSSIVNKYVNHKATTENFDRLKNF